MKHCLINKFYKCDKLNCGICGRSQFYLRDSMNFDFPLIRSNNCNLVLLNSKRLYLLKYLQEIKSLGINNILLDFTVESREETKDILNEYINVINGGKEKLSIDGFTYGHYLKGIE